MSRRRGASRQPDWLTMFCTSSGAPQKVHAVGFVFCPPHHLQTMRWYASIDVLPAPACDRTSALGAATAEAITLRMTRVRRADEAEWVRPTDVAEGAVVSVFRVPPEVAGQRLDVFLQAQLQTDQPHARAGTSSARARTTTSGAASARTIASAPSSRSSSGARRGTRTPSPPRSPSSTRTSTSSPSTSRPFCRCTRRRGTTRTRSSRCSRRKRPGEWLSLGHRLDRETSGVILLAKSPACDRALKHALRGPRGDREDVPRDHAGACPTRATARAPFASSGASSSIRRTRPR